MVPVYFRLQLVVPAVDRHGFDIGEVQAVFDLSPRGGFLQAPGYPVIDGIHDLMQELGGDVIRPVVSQHVVQQQVQRFQLVYLQSFFHSPFGSVFP